MNDVRTIPSSRRGGHYGGSQEVPRDYGSGDQQIRLSLPAPDGWNDSRFDRRLAECSFELCERSGRLTIGGEMQPSGSHVVFLETFFDELKRRAPVKR